MDAPPATVDLEIEPVDGYRVWRLAGEGAGTRLAAVTRRTIWPALEPMLATCPEHLPGEVPGADCMCGLYAASSLRSLVRAGVLQHRTVGAVGAIAMWGRVVEHDRGVRSSLAYPARIRLVCGPCLSERRGPVDPLRVAIRDGQRVPLCARHLDPGEGGVSAAEVLAHLLDAYAVELMPADVATRGLGHGRAAAALLRRIDTAPRIPERLRMPVRIGGIVAAVAILAFGAMTLPRRSAPAPDAPPALATGTGRIAPATSATSGTRRAATQPPSAVSQSRLPGVMCGVVAGGAIQEVACRAGRADAVGVTSSPPASRGSCGGTYEWYTRGHTWSACWFVDPGPLRHLRRAAR
jgi:hypothetical protein